MVHTKDASPEECVRGEGTGIQEHTASLTSLRNSVRLLGPSTLTKPIFHAKKKFNVSWYVVKQGWKF